MTDEPLRDELLGRLAARTGHFRLESGHHGELWLDLDPLFLRPTVLRRFAAVLAEKLSAHHVEAVCGPLVGGAFLAQMVASVLDVEFFYAERIARPHTDALYPVHYRVPDGLRPHIRGKAVAVVDDVINAGSAVRGTWADLLACAAKPVAVGALLVLGDAASDFAAANNVPLASLVRRPSNLWRPADCPLCASDVPLQEGAAPSLAIMTPGPSGA